MRRHLAVFGTLLLLVPMGVVVQATAAGAGGAGPTVCGGTVAAPQVLAGGTYASVDVNGVCDISAGQVIVTGSVTVEAGGALVSAFGLNNKTLGTVSDLTINGDLTSATGASLVLGCGSLHFTCFDEPNPGSPTLNSATAVHGNLTAESPLGFILHRVSVGGDLRSTGGGGGKTCANSPGANVFYAIPGNGGAVYSDLEDSTVGGNLWVTGLTSCWFGALRDRINGSASFVDLTFMDSDSIEVLSSTVGGNMVCLNDAPALQFGDAGQVGNLVGGYGTGQCAFSRLVRYGTSDPPIYLPIATHDSTHNGYWLAASDGGIFSFGTAFYGSGAGQGVPVDGFSASPGGYGYQLATSTGTVSAYGPHPSCSGSIPATNRPIVGMAAVPGGGGCWLVASDGGIFTYGPTAAFYGSTGALTLNQPIVGMAPAPSGDGYYLVAADGGIFAFGPGASFQGSMGGQHLNRPIVGMAAAPDGMGYYMVATDGGIFSFGTAVFQGSTGAIQLARPIIGMALR